jgi:arginine/lysine/ornithine decarboxylase
VEAEQYLSIAAKMGMKESLDMIKFFYCDENLHPALRRMFSKERLAEIELAYEDAQDEMKSADRDMAALVGLRNE